MKSNYDPKTELIKIFDNINHKGQVAILSAARGLFYSGIYNKNVIWVDFRNNNDQIKNNPCKPT